MSKGGQQGTKENLRANQNEHNTYHQSPHSTPDLSSFGKQCLQSLQVEINNHFMDANDDPTKSLMALFLDPRTAPFAQTWITNDVLYGSVKEYTQSKLAICLDDMGHVSDDRTLVITDLDAEEEDDSHKYLCLKVQMTLSMYQCLS